MGLAKQQQIEHEFHDHQMKLNQRDGYRKRLENEGTYAGTCPYCEGAFSKIDMKNETCPHCQHALFPED